MFKYEPKLFPNLAKLTNIPVQEFEEHLKLYNGYVTNCNVYREKIAALIDGAQTGTPEYQAMMRRLGFEYDGMILHEYYFDSLNTENNSLDSAPALKAKVEAQFGSVEKFVDHYKKVTMMRGIGWACLYQDVKNDQISVHFVGEHENGHPAGFNLLMAVDAWEHAWTAYLKPTEKAKYVEDIFAVIDWAIVESRLK
jgi:Fe-Mn family superoxide dismutase